MSTAYLEAATKGIKSLVADTKKVEYQGCESMKLTFLGGMREGQSWGLRRWLSKHGAALQVCNDLEMILTAIQKLDKECPFTIKMAAKLRKEASYARNRLVKDVPTAYQQFSSAHPFLPFFHRLESVLKGLAEFDPEDDDVIIIDDNDAEQEKAKAEQKKLENLTEQKSVEIKSEKRALEINDLPPRKRAHQSTDADNATSGSSESVKASEVNDESDDDSVLCVAVRTFDGKEVQISDTNKDHLSDKKRDAFAPSPLVDTAAPTLAPTDPEGVATDDPAYCQIKQMFESEKEYFPVQGDWRCSECTFMNMTYSDVCLMCESVRATNNNTAARSGENGVKLDTLFDISNFWDTIEDNPTPCSVATATANVAASNNAQVVGDAVAERLQELARRVEEFQYSTNHGTPRMDYWDIHWSFVISLFALILREREAPWFLEPVNEEELIACGRPEYRSVVRNPLSFRCIINALNNSRLPGGNGKLVNTDLPFDVRHGRELLQAIDLVFLNALAYNSGRINVDVRRDTLKLRRMFWDQIKAKAADHRGEIPTKRGVTSGFVVVRHATLTR